VAEVAPPVEHVIRQPERLPPPRAFQSTVRPQAWIPEDLNRPGQPPFKMTAGVIPDAHEHVPVSFESPPEDFVPHAVWLTGTLEILDEDLPASPPSAPPGNAPAFEIRIQAATRSK